MSTHPKEKNLETPARRGLHARPFVLHIDIDAFFAAVEILHNPALKGKPVIIGGQPDERGVVSTASYEARKFGVHSGMALRTAGQKCPQGVFLRGRYHVYSEISRQFFSCLSRFSPCMDAVSIDEAYLDLGGSSYLYSSVYEMAAQIKRAVERETGLKVSAGLGFSRLGAKLATEAAKPGNFFSILEERPFIENVSLEKIPGIGPHSLLILNGLGIRKVKELEKSYPSIWKRTVGPHFFSGSSFPAKKEPKTRSFSRETTFHEDISDTDLLLSHLAYLVGRLATHLIQNKLYAGRIEVKARFRDFSTYTRRAPLDFPTYSYPLMWKKARSLFIQLTAKRKLPLRLLGVKVEDISERRDILPFVDRKSELLSAGIRDIKEKFGFSSIYTAREMMLEDLYPREKEGLVLKTASLTK